LTYRHPREIEDFDRLATNNEPTVKKTASKISLRQDGDGPRDWTLERLWGGGLGRTCLAFTILDRPSPSAMAKQLNLRLFYIRYGEDAGWWVENVDRFRAWSISREEVDELVPAKFSRWVEEQGSQQFHGTRAA
jgi:hypothetical protein